MLLSLIVACDKNRVIGRFGELPWRLPRDLRRFKELSMGKTLVMGRKTHQSIGRILPGRKNIVITSKPNLVKLGCVVYPSLEKALDSLKEEIEVLIIGGETIYRESLPSVSRIYMTEVDGIVMSGDVHFPKINLSEWRSETIAKYPPDHKHEFGMIFKILERK